MKAILLPGNGTGDITDAMWYPWIKKKLEELGIPTTVTNFPDPLYARESIWVPFVIDTLGADDQTILIGHSSGAACTLRILEKHKVLGAVLVSAYSSDLGDPIERESGYFNRPFDWNKMKSNAEWILQFHSRDDHLVPFEEAEHVHKELGTEFTALNGWGHFQRDDIEPVLSAICKKLNKT